MTGGSIGSLAGVQSFGAWVQPNHKKREAKVTKVNSTRHLQCADRSLPGAIPVHCKPVAGVSGPRPQINYLRSTNFMDS